MPSVDPKRRTGVGPAASRSDHAVRGIPQVRALHTTNGAWDLVAELHADNRVEFERVLRGIRAMDGVSKSETSLLLTTL